MILYQAIRSRPEK